MFMRFLVIAALLASSPVLAQQASDGGDLGLVVAVAVTGHGGVDGGVSGVTAVVDGGAGSHLTDAGTPPALVPAPTPAPTPTPTPEWKFTASPEEGLTISRADDRLFAQAGVLLQPRYQVRAAGGAVTDHLFQLLIVRPYLRLQLLVPWVRVFLQTELAVSQRLLDLEFDVQPWPALGVKFGQFVTPFSRAFMTPVPKFLMPTLSVANGYFRGDRDTGVMLYGMPFGGRLEYFAGVFNGNGIDKGANDNKEFSYYLRVAATLFGTAPATNGHVHYDDTPTLQGRLPATLQVGVNGYTNRTNPTTQVVDPVSMQLVNKALTPHTWLTGGLDAHFHVANFVLQGELYTRSDTADGGQAVWSLGGSAHASLMIVPKWFELAVRYTLLNTNQSQAKQQLTVYEAQAATYPLGNHLKASVTYSLGQAESATSGYPAGLSHTVVAEVQTWL